MTIQSEIILNKKLNGDVGITQNSVEVFSSINAAAIVNTLCLKEGKVGIGVASPTTKLSITNAGTITALYVEQNGELAASTGSVYIYSNTAQVNNPTPLLYVRSNNASSTHQVVYIRNYGSGRSLQIDQNGVSVQPCVQIYSNAAQVNSVALLQVWQDGASSTAQVLEIINDGTGSSLVINQNGVLASTKYALYIKSDTIQNASPLIYFLQDNSSSNQDLLVLKQDGTGHALILINSVYDDIQFSISAGKSPAANYPNWETFTTNTAEYAFSVDDYIDCQANELAHWWKQGTAGHVHLHFTIKTAQSTGQNRFVKFSVWVAYADTDEVWVEQTVLSAEKTIPTASGALKAFYLDIGDAILTDYLIGGQIKLRVKRIAATGGTEYADDIYITQVGIHIEKDTLGSRTETTK